MAEPIRDLGAMPTCTLHIQVYPLRMSPTSFHKATQRVAVVILLSFSACKDSTSGQKSTAAEPKATTPAQKLETAYRRMGLDTIKCKEGTSGKTTYVGCRYGGDDSGSMIWYVEGDTVYGANGDAMSKVAELNEPWIKEGARPAPSGVDIQEGMRVTR